jgi:anti-sigma regulatory factor (Ser/Thr protein kinase)
MEKIKVEAKVENLQQVLDFITSRIEAAGGGMKPQMQIEVAAEELFVNIASYAYGDKTGDAEIAIDINDNVASIDFIDSGVPYDPLAKEDPDVTLSAQERQIGGLGIFMVKKTMDDVLYNYVDGKNITTIKKTI